MGLDALSAGGACKAIILTYPPDIQRRNERPLAWAHASGQGPLDSGSAVGLLLRDQRRKRKKKKKKKRKKEKKKRKKEKKKRKKRKNKID